MALTLIKEDGTGRSDANAYANAADGDASAGAVACVSRGPVSPFSLGRN